MYVFMSAIVAVLLLAGQFAMAASFCTPNDVLINDRGREVYKFDYGFQCEAARQSLDESGSFCSPSDELINARGKKLYDFDYSFQCKGALEKLVDRNEDAADAE